MTLRPGFGEVSSARIRSTRGTASPSVNLQNSTDSNVPNIQLDVIACDGWSRDWYFEQTGLPWVMPSPNMPTVDTAVVYPGMCLIEGTNLSKVAGRRGRSSCAARRIDPRESGGGSKRSNSPACVSARRTSGRRSRSSPASIAAGATSRDGSHDLPTGTHRAGGFSDDA